VNTKREKGEARGRKKREKPSEALWVSWVDTSGTDFRKSREGREKKISRKL